MDIHNTMGQEMTNFFGTVVSTGGSWVGWFPEGWENGGPNTHNQEHRAYTDNGFPSSTLLVAKQCSIAWCIIIYLTKPLL